MTPDPSIVMQGAKCLTCIPAGLRDAAQLYALLMNN